METANRTFLLFSLLIAALAATANAGQKPASADSSIHLVSCSVEKVNQCLAQESASGYVVVHIATTVVDRPRATPSPGYGLVRSEDPVLVTRKSDVAKRQTVAIIDDLAKRETQLNQAGAAGMQLLPNQIAVLRSWRGGASGGGGFGVVRNTPGGVSVDGYAALFEQVTPLARFEYRIVDVADKAVSEKLKTLLSDGYRSVAIVAPAILVMERRVGDMSKTDEYRILQGLDAQHIAPELAKATGDGFRIVSAGVSTTGLLTHVLLEQVPGDKGRVEYRVSSTYGAQELEKQLNDTAQAGYSPVMGGILPVITREGSDRGMTTPPQRVELIVGNTGPTFSGFKVLNAFGKDQQAKIGAAIQDDYEFMELVGLMNENFVILGRQTKPPADGKN